MDVRLLVVIYLMISLVSVAVASPYRSRSRNKNSAPTYDQKQTGEYNIQLHLKDFEVVALLSDSAFGELGDYDYNYDYSEITLKPPAHSQTSTTTTSESAQSSTTVKPSQKPETILPSTSTTAYASESPASTYQAVPAELSAATEKLMTSAAAQQHQTVESSTQFAQPPVSTSRLETDLENVNLTKEELNTKHSTVKTEIIVKPVESLTIVDNEKPATPEETIPVVIHRKCANGFTRDKLGRCRRVRRPPPQFSFGISRLATLASKLRHGTNDSQIASDPLQESLEE